MNWARSFYSQRRLKSHKIILESEELYFKEDRDQLLPLASKEQKEEYWTPVSEENFGLNIRKNLKVMLIVREKSELQRVKWDWSQ